MSWIEGMRHSTPEEQEAHRRMIDGMSTKLVPETELDFQIRDNWKLTMENDRLKDENEKLRKLAKRMWPFAKAYLNMLPTLGIPDSESYDIEIELSELHII